MRRTPTILASLGLVTDSTGTATADTASNGPAGATSLDNAGQPGANNK